MDAKTPKTELTRCEWTGSDSLMVDYHDQEWGLPLHDDRKLFEFLILEGMQAGLSCCWGPVVDYLILRYGSHLAMIRHSRILEDGWHLPETSMEMDFLMC